MVPPSTTVTIQFNENVQAGDGNINVGLVGVPVGDCTFLASTIVCDPLHGLARNMLYSISYSSTVIENIAGNILTNKIGSTKSTLELTTINLDYKAPVMIFAGGTNFTYRRLYPTP